MLSSIFISRNIPYFKKIQRHITSFSNYRLNLPGSRETAPNLIFIFGIFIETASALSL